MIILDTMHDTNVLYTNLTCISNHDRTWLIPYLYIEHFIVCRANPGEFTLLLRHGIPGSWEWDKGYN
ncbi:hypothetical protein HanXRQr2_Chr09g0370811 [Helianthus annuus]|uniref:Uncharacterized protein n=1 Tax=Helianthus annuus TaxID=4232 RepID=A0A9K3I3K2_HELAN|nr:hypothetical protein HanXRQr2_Chr09g0370811 [Helianthus annuus]KAJ0891708.1 hypothetical protein HanPSC8_Chr09g0357231 [Helianthus annuus]